MEVGSREKMEGRGWIELWISTLWLEIEGGMRGINKNRYVVGPVRGILRGKSASGTRSQTGVCQGSAERPEEKVLQRVDRQRKGVLLG